MMNESNVYDVTFSDGVRKCWLYCTSEDYNEWNIVDCETLLGTGGLVEGEGEDFIINNSNKTVNAENLLISGLQVPNLTYNYFCNSHLSAWKVWYCLDNDTARFAWADVNPNMITTSGGESYAHDAGDYYRDSSKDVGFGNNTLYGWTSQDNVTIYTASLTPEIEDVTYDEDGDDAGGAGAVVSVNGEHGRGVIYRLIDEFNNDVAYDFKNIQFIRPLTDGTYDPDDGEDTWVYTLNNIDENQQPYDASLNTTTYDNSVNNKIGSWYVFINDKNYFVLNQIVALYGGGNNHIELSHDITILLNVAEMFGCTDCVIGDENSQFYICDALTTTESDDSAIYINNKKVLTES